MPSSPICSSIVRNSMARRTESAWIRRSIRQRSIAHGRSLRVEQLEDRRLLAVVAEWKLDEGSGNVAHDSVDNHDGMIAGATWDNGISGNALLFDGMNDYVEVPDSDALDPVATDEITIEAWVYVTDFQAVTSSVFHSIVGKTATSGRENGGYTLGIANSRFPAKQVGKLFFEIVFDGLHFQEVHSTNAVPLNRWVHVAFTHDANNVSKFYIDGQLDSVDTSTITQGFRNTSHNFRIGHSNSFADFFKGRIDEVRIHDTAVVPPFQPPILGLDRWWATVGEAPIDVSWMIRVNHAADYQLDIDIAGIINTWDLADPALVRIDGLNTVAFDSFGQANLGILQPGFHTLKVESFEVPTVAIVEGVDFKLIDRDAVALDQSLSALFIADWPDIDRNARFDIEVDDIVTSDLTVDELVDEFAPILHFSDGEQYYPVNIEHLIGDVATHIDDRLAVDGQGNAADWLNLAPYEDPAKGPHEPTIYGTVLVCQPGQAGCTAGVDLAINYYFLSARSNWFDFGGRNTHEGDSEGITVFLQRQSGNWRPLSVAYAQHDVTAVPVLARSQIVNWDHIKRLGSRPRVYVGLGGHASYPFPGLTDVELAGVFREKEAHDGRQLEVAAAQIHFVPRISSGNAPEWFTYPGYLGNPDLAGDGQGPIDGDEAPRGPAFLRRVRIGANDEVLGSVFGERYLDPFGKWQAPFTEFTPGVVTVQTKENKVTITGNKDADHIKIERDENNPQKLKISGLHGTTINGQTSIPETKHLTINLGDGHNAVTLHDLALIDLLKITIDSGSGDDLVRLQEVNKSPANVLDLKIKTGAGTDLIELIDSSFGDPTRNSLVDQLFPPRIVATGHDDDEILVRHATIEGTGEFNGGTGDDLLWRAPLDPLFDPANPLSVTLSSIEELRDLIS